MQYESVTWNACLESTPKIVHAAIGAPSIGTFDFLMRDCWCLYLFLPPWEGKSEVDGVPFPFSPGFAVLVPPGVKQRYQFFARSTHLYVHFRLSRSKRRTMPIRAAQQMGDQFESFRHDFEQLIANANALRQRAEVKLWDMLWDLSQRRGALPTTGVAQLGGENIADRVAKQIELELARPLTLQSLAAQVGVSPAHLTRMFKAYTGTTVIQFIRQRRVAHAQYLLRTTARPIKSIAHEVGIPDLHHFNKIIRASLGSSPRDVRAGR